ncbi:ATP-grasp domain-containing protein [Pedococcus sp. 5OH_020]|uniref:ATP-grasp domain-containing protein n=1 Tax=Pedococcus sp. 5OH_020 TaxID=2989814 RepID=UPI0022E9EEF6|nr:ATP-grasp domain-containing protein [Pedococcus sp. 5OH_020]
MNIVFVEPGFPANQRRFVLALASVGANVIGIGESDEYTLDDELRDAMSGYYKVGSVTSVHEMTEAVRFVQSKVWVDRLEATVEAHTMPAAQVREAAGIPGTSVRTTWLCRDKPSMKQALREAGVPTAASTAADHAHEVWAFAESVGYPLILKPRDGAGAKDTVRVDGDSELSHALTDFGSHGSTSIAVEEFVEGHEGFYDTITRNGRVVHDWTTHYYPNVLEAMRTRWISPQFVTTNRMADSDFYREVAELGQRVIEALGIETSATHMEWFYGPKGLRFSEIGCRPPGVGCWDLYSASNDVDVYREWAHIITYGMPEHQMRRPYAAGIVALRPTANGTIQGYSGIDEIQGRYGEWILDGHFPPQGHHTQPVEAGYMANAYVRMRHPDYDTLRGMLDDVGQTITVHAG